MYLYHQQRNWRSRIHDPAAATTVDEDRIAATPAVLVGVPRLLRFKIHGFSAPRRRAKATVPEAASTAEIWSSSRRPRSPIE